MWLPEGLAQEYRGSTRTLPREKKISLVDVEKLLLHVGLHAAQYQALQRVDLKSPAFA